jgi:Flp pilus assembly protein CpaB
MNRAGRLLFIFGVVIALGSGFFVFLLLALSNQSKPADVATLKLVIAVQNISPRTEIQANQLQRTDWPAALPTPIGGYEQISDVTGKLATSPLAPGQPVTDRVVVDKKDLKETHSSAALILEKGNVAVAMPVTIKSSVAQAIQAGDRVDVIATLKSPSGGTGTATQRVLADMLILQVGPWPGADSKGQSQSSGGAAVITLQLKEQDVLALESTQQFASEVTLVLRSAEDHDIQQLEPVTFDYINQRFNFKLR